jgi:hypothetical protein
MSIETLLHRTENRASKLESPHLMVIELKTENKENYARYMKLEIFCFKHRKPYNSEVSEPLKAMALVAFNFSAIFSNK